MRRQQRWYGITALCGLNLLCLGLAILSRFIASSWQVLFGLLLFGQVLFFMAICVLLARLTPLSPDHRSFAGMSPQATIERMEQLRKQLTAADIIGGILAIGLGIMWMIVAALVPRFAPTISTIAPVLLGFGVALLAHATTLIAHNTTHAYLLHTGVPATARVLGVTNLRKSQRSATYDRARWYRLELEVMPGNEAPYTTSIEQLIRQHPSNMPAPGALIPIRYLPQHPGMIVALLNPEDRRADS